MKTCSIKKSIKHLKSLGYSVVKAGRKAKSSGRKLRPGVHKVRINGTLRKVKVLTNGRWRFMKG